MSWANLLDSIRRSGTRPRVLYPSSAAVYGNPQQLPVSEMADIRPISPYGFHKVACELIGREYSECYGLSVTVMRLFSVFGPRQRRLLVWELFSQAQGQSPDIILQGTGEETRDYMHVNDVAEIMLDLASLRSDAYLAVNVASGVEVQALEVAREVATHSGVDKPIRCRGLRSVGDPIHWRADIGLLRQFLAVDAAPFTQRLADCIREWQCVSR